MSVEWGQTNDGARVFMFDKTKCHTDPHLMDCHFIDGQWWLGQYTLYSTYLRGNPDQRTGPFATLDDAKAVAEMMYETLVVKG